MSSKVFNLVPQVMPSLLGRLGISRIYCPSPFLSSFLFVLLFYSLFSPSSRVCVRQPHTPVSVCVFVCQWQVSLSHGSGLGAVLSCEPSSCPACHCGLKEKRVFVCCSFCVFLRVAGLQPLGRPGSSAGCGDSSRQQQAAGPGPLSGLPLPGTSCVCGKQQLLPSSFFRSYSPFPLNSILCFCAPCLMSVMTFSVVL